jgi:hypothetical protein
MDYLSFGIRLWLALVCAIAVLGKVRSRRSYGEFVMSLELTGRAVPLVRAPAVFARSVAAPLVAAECATAVLLSVPATAVVGGVFAVVLFGGLTAGVAVAVATGTPAPCACFGRITRNLGWSHVVRNAVLLVGAGVALGLSLAGAGGAVGPAPAVAAGLAAAMATLVVVFWSDISATFAAVTPVFVEQEVRR